MAVNLIPYIIMALGAAAQSRAQNKAYERQQAGIVEAEGRQDEIQKRQEALTMENLKQYDPTVRAEAQDQAALTAEKALNDELVKATSTGSNDVVAAEGRVSDSYLSDRARSVMDSLKKASHSAGLMSRVRAPTDLRFNESVNNAGYASDTADLGAIGRGRWGTDQRIIGGIRPDPTQMFLGGLAQSYGTMGAQGDIMSGGTTSGAGVGGSSKPWWDISSSPRKL